jgi:hypothetical protein
LQESSNYAVCTEDVHSLNIAVEIYHNQWSYNQYQGAGQIGLGMQNSVWESMFPQGYPGYSLQMGPFNNGTSF